MLSSAAQRVQKFFGSFFQKRTASFQGREQGFALLIVLWSLVLLSLILTQLLAAGRSEAQLAANLRNSATAEAVADGAVQETLFHLIAGGAQAWAPRGTYQVRIGRGAADVTIANLADRINPNTADVGLLRALIGLCGASAAQAAQLAEAVTVWRGDPDADANGTAIAYRTAGLGYLPPGMPLQTLDELGLIAGMTPPVLACLRPHLSLLQDGVPGPTSADRVVARAVALAEQGDALAGTPPVADVTAVEITAVAQVPGGRFTRRAAVRLTPSPRGLPFTIITWDRPADPD